MVDASTSCRLRLLVVARLKGQSYPSEAIESSIFIEQFQSPKQISRFDDSICLTYSVKDDEHELFPNVISFRLNYAIVEKEEYDQCNTGMIDKLIVCKSYTTIKMATAVDVLMKRFTNIVSQEIAPHSLIITPHDRALNNSVIQLKHMQRLDPNNALFGGYFDELVDVLMCRVFPALVRQPTFSVAESLGFNLVLLEHSHGIQLSGDPSIKLSMICVTLHQTYVVPCKYARSG